MDIIDIYNTVESGTYSKKGETTEYSDEEKKEIYKAYRSAVNMSATQLEKWAESECSKRASVNRSPINRNLKLLRTKKEDWTGSDYSSANRTISFVSRMLGVKDGKPVNKDCPYSKKFISLANWARWHSVKHG